MIPEKNIIELVDAHARLEEPMSGAIWIRPDANEAWLVEVLPGMEDDERAGEPTRFGPGAHFRFPIALVAGNFASLASALEGDAELASAVANGVILYERDGQRDASRLVEVARAMAGKG